MLLPPLESAASRKSRDCLKRLATPQKERRVHERNPESITKPRVDCPDHVRFSEYSVEVPETSMLNASTLSLKEFKCMISEVVFYVAHQLMNAYPTAAVAWFTAGAYLGSSRKFGSGKWLAYLTGGPGRLARQAGAHELRANVTQTTTSDLSRETCRASEGSGPTPRAGCKDVLPLSVDLSTVWHPSPPRF